MGKHTWYKQHHIKKTVLRWQLTIHQLLLINFIQLTTKLFIPLKDLFIYLLLLLFFFFFFGGGGGGVVTQEWKVDWLNQDLCWIL